MYKKVKAMPERFPLMVCEHGNPEAKAPSGFGDNKEYVNCWDNRWLAERLFNQWRYAHAKFTGKKAARNWFWDSAEQNELDWKTTAMKVMNAEYAGNASYEWFEWRVNEKGENQMYRVNQFDRIEDTSDPRLDNQFLDFLFTYPEKTLGTAMREFRKALSEKKN